MDQDRELTGEEIAEAILPAPRGSRWVSASNLKEHAAREAEARRNPQPSSIYYRSAPPDEDDFWQWCRMCRCWHSHGPCF